MTAAKEKRRRSAHSDRPSELGLDNICREVLELTALLLARRRYSRRELLAFFEECLGSTPDSVGLNSDETHQDRDRIPGEVLTRWYLLPEYVSNGQPRPLAAVGPLSVATLVRSIDRRANPTFVLAYLLQTEAVRKAGTRYIPQDRIVQHRFSPHLQRMHHVNVVLGLLRTVEGNARRRKELRQFQFVTEAVIPEHLCTQFAAEIAEPARELLKFADAVAFRLSEQKVAGESTANASVSIHLSDGKPLPPLNSSRRELKQRTKEVRKT